MHALLSRMVFHSSKFTSGSQFSGDGGLHDRGGDRRSYGGDCVLDDRGGGNIYDVSSVSSFPKVCDAGPRSPVLVVPIVINMLVGPARYIRAFYPVIVKIW